MKPSGTTAPSQTSKASDGASNVVVTTPITGARDTTGGSTTPSFLDLAAPTVSISKEVWAKLHHWVKKGASHECSGMGKVTVEGGGSQIVVTDAWMIKQQNSGAESELDADDFGRVMFQKKDVPGSWYFWWHSHSSMPVFWSGTDRDTIVKLANNGACVALVLNTRGESKLCLAIGKPFLLFMDDVKIDVYDPSVTKEQRAEWDAEYDAKVSAKWSYGGPSMEGGYDWWNHGEGAWPVGDRPTFNSSRSFPGDTDDFHSRYRNKQSSAVGQSRTEIARGADRQVPQGKEDSLQEVDATAADLAWKRLEEIQLEVEVIDYTLRERKITKRFCNIIDVVHEDGLEIDSIISDGDQAGQDLEQAANDKLVELFEEEDVIQDALAKYTASRQFPDKTKEKK